MATLIFPAQTKQRADPLQQCDRTVPFLCKEIRPRLVGPGAILRYFLHTTVKMLTTLGWPNIIYTNLYIYVITF